MALSSQTPIPSEVGITRNHGKGGPLLKIAEGVRSTLDPDGGARKSIGATHGTWTLVDNEARITWDDGWHDAIRKVGTRHEKVAFQPGKSFDDPPSNVTAARSTEPKSI